MKIWKLILNIGHAFLLNLYFTTKPTKEEAIKALYDEYQHLPSMYLEAGKRIINATTDGGGHYDKIEVHKVMGRGWAET